MTKEIDEKTARFLEMVRATGKDGWSSMSAGEWDALIPPAGFVDLDGNPIDISTEEGARKLTELMSEPTAEEIAFFDDRDKRAMWAAIRRDRPNPELHHWRKRVTGRSPWMPLMQIQPHPLRHSAWQYSRLSRLSC